MGRWCSIIGVVIGIFTAYAAMLFANILTYLQMLVVFFIVPLFGVVIVGMLWKQATKAGGFWGLLLGTLASVSMFLFVHWFPTGYAPFLGGDLKDLPALVSRLEKPDGPAAEFLSAHLSKTTRECIGEYQAELKSDAESQSSLGKLADSFKEESRAAKKVRIALTEDLNTLLKDPALGSAKGFEELDKAGQAAVAKTEASEASHVKQLSEQLDQLVKDPQSITPERLAGIAGSKEVRGIEKDNAALLHANRKLLDAAFAKQIAPMRALEATQVNPRHAEIVGTSPKATDQALIWFSGFWSLLLTFGTVVMVSLFTKGKSDDELKDLVYGLTPLPDQGKGSWYESPLLWAAVVGAVLIAINVIFW
jgi:hypothetical protein